MNGSCDGNRGHRRAFLKASASAGVTLISADVLRAQAPAAAALPTITLGKTGVKVPRLGMGTSWDVAPSFVQAALFSGITYIDTSESYEEGRSEKTLGEVIERTKKRKDVYLVSKNNRYKRGQGGVDPAIFPKQLEGSLERLRTDYLDCYYIHGLEGRYMDILKDPAVKAEFEKLKKSGKIRFCGLSCHDAKLPEILDLAAEVGWLDQVMLQYNFRFVDHDKLQRALDKAAKANLGLIAMKTQKGAAESLPDKVNAFTAKGFKKEVAAIKSVFQDDRIHVVVSEMTNFTEMKDNIGATREPLTKQEARLLEEYRVKTANLYCHGCGHLCESSANGLPVATVLRYLRYYQAYGKREQARALYQALPVEARAFAHVDFTEAEAACPHGLPIASLLARADQSLGC